MFVGFSIKLRELLSGLQHGRVVTACFDHLLKRRLGASYIASLQIDVAHVDADARPYAENAAGLQCTRQQASGLLGLIQAQAEFDEAPSQLVVARIPRDHGS